MTNRPVREVSSVLLHGGDPVWRRTLRESLLERTRRQGTDATSLVVLLSSRDAEAAKWLVDPRLVLIVAAEDAQLRRSIAALAAAVDVLWLPAASSARADLALVEEILRRLREAGAVGS